MFVTILCDLAVAALRRVKKVGGDMAYVQYSHLLFL